MAFSLPVPKLDPRRLFDNRIGHRPRGLGFLGRSGLSRLAGRILLGLGSIAAVAYAAIPCIRRTAPARARSSAAAAAHVPPAASVFTDPASDAGSSSAANPLERQGSGLATSSQNEPWTDSVRRAMEKKPLSFGYDKSVWTAPLLSQYLMETHGVAVPAPRLRNALKDMGYHWKHTHYVQTRHEKGV